MPTDIPIVGGGLSGLGHGADIHAQDHDLLASRMETAPQFGGHIEGAFQAAELANKTLTDRSHV